jgi:four helix bundle protein
MSFARAFTELKVWQEGHRFVVEIYNQTNSFPKAELFGLTSQIRRSASSVTSNVTEGFERGGKKEFAQFLRIARGSLAETQNHLILARDLGYLHPSAFAKLADQTILIHKLLNGLIRSLQTSAPANKRTSN